MITKLKNIGTVITGNTPKTSEEKNYATPDIPFVKPSDLCNETITLIDDTEFHISEYARDKARIVPANSVFMTCIGIIGKVGINNCECAFNQQINVVVPNTKKCLCEYLAYALVNKKDIIQATANAPVVPILNKTQFENIEIDIPNLEKQKEVVAVLTKIDYLISTRKQQVLKLDELIKSRFIEMFDNCNYPIVRAEEVCDFITKGTTPPTGEIYEEFNDNRVPYLKVYNLSFDGSLLFNHEPQFIAKAVHNGKLSRSKVYPNDVLMNIVGPPLGKFSLVTDEYPEWNINQAISIFRAKKNVLPRFLLSALMQPSVLEPFLKQAVGVRQLNISLEQCRNLQFPLPPLDLQNQFATFVEQTDKLKFEAKQSLEKLEMLKKALMQEYFG